LAFAYWQAQDCSLHSSWNPFIRSIEGVVEKGKRLTVSIQPVGGKAMTFRPTVLVATPNVELRRLHRHEPSTQGTRREMSKPIGHGSGGLHLAHCEVATSFSEGKFVRTNA
jgi:hypothetical protein